MKLINLFSISAAYKYILSDEYMSTKMKIKSPPPSENELTPKSITKIPRKKKWDLTPKKKSQEFPDDLFVIQLDGDPDVSEMEYEEDISIIEDVKDKKMKNPINGNLIHENSIQKISNGLMTPKALKRTSSTGVKTPASAFSTVVKTSLVSKRKLEEAQLEDITKEKIAKRALLSKFSSEAVGNISFSDLGGLEPLKNALLKLMRRVKMAPLQCVTLLLTGPSGVGKVMMHFVLYKVLRHSVNVYQTNHAIR